MNKIRVIDLLNKIANGDIPKKIKYENVIYEYDNYKGDSGYVNMTQEPYKWFEKEIDCDAQGYLNDEVEILEEPKGIPEKIDLDEFYGVDYNDGKYIFAEKINEIIDYLEYLESKGESNE